ncbi:MAG: hypothetical protein WBI98_05940, partial [Tepidanaerobacteraceae bacterium]|jgi:hypothetical protein
MFNGRFSNKKEPVAYADSKLVDCGASAYFHAKSWFCMTFSYDTGKGVTDLAISYFDKTVTHIDTN